METAISRSPRRSLARLIPRPKQVSIDLSANKTIHVGEKTSVELRVDAFNLFNHSNFVTLNNTYATDLRA